MAMTASLHSYRESHAFFILGVFVLLLILLLPVPCAAQDAAKAEVNRLNKKYEELEKQGRYKEAIKYAEKLIPTGEKAYGKEHPFMALFQNNLAQLYSKIGNYDKAKSLYQKALIIGEKGFGQNHPVVGLILNNLAELYSSESKFSAAEPLYKRSYAIFKQHFGSDHIQVAKSLHNMASFYKKLGQYTKAEPMYKKSLAIMEKNLGPEHSNVATSLNNLANLYYLIGDYRKAEPLYKRSLKIRQKVLGPEHPDVATSLNQMAEFYHSLGAYAKAQDFSKRSLKILQNAFGPEHPKVATSFAQLASFYYALEDYAEAESLFMRSLEIRLRALGPEHSDVAKNYNSLATIYLRLGDLEKAKALFTRALAINQKKFGPNHPSVASILSNLAILYHYLGDHAKAASLSMQSLAIKENALGSEHPDVTVNLDYLAELYQLQEDYAQALRLLQKSLNIRKKAFGPEHPEVAQSLIKLGGYYFTVGDFTKAESLYKSSLEIWEKFYGAEHLNVARNLNNLALLYKTTGDYIQAKKLHQRSLSISQKRLGREHQEVATCLSNLALDYAAINDFQTAHRYNKKVQEIENKLIERIFGFTSERQKIDFLKTQKGDLYSFLSLIVQHLPQNEMAMQDGLDFWLKRKGMVLEAQKRYQEALIYADNLQVVETFQKLSKIRAQLSRLTFAGTSAKGLDEHNRNLKSLEAQKENLEAELSRISEPYAVSRKVAKADREKVAQKLPPNSALLEFAKILMFNFKAKGKEERWQPAHYLTFILHAGDGDDVRMVDLGRSDEIDEAIFEFKKEITDIKKQKKINFSSNKLYELVFKPLKNQLGSAKEIFIAPDGNLNLLPFEVIQGPDGRFLIEDYSFNYLAAGRDVLGFGEKTGEGRKVVLMGDPDFNLATEDRISIARNLNLDDTSLKRMSEFDSEMRGFLFSRLPGTKEEVMAIHDILGKDEVEVFTDKKALEELLYRKRAPKILHLATHGFFLEDPKMSAGVDNDFPRGLSLSKTEYKTTKMNNLLLRSGIALAGANHSIKFRQGKGADGIVTAEKILGLNLYGTDMVVLSACETGLGKVKTGEGVFGLRRAFAQAGAISLVMSMWSVPDKETKELMVEFYKNIALGRMNKCQALRQAALKQMTVVKTRYGHKNPFYWGAFVFLGEP